MYIQNAILPKFKQRYFYIMLKIRKLIPNIREEFEFGNGHSQFERSLLILFLITCHVINFSPYFEYIRVKRRNWFLPCTQNNRR
jgi:hypothetical protein